MVTLYKPTAEFVSQMRKAGQIPQFSTLSPSAPICWSLKWGAKEAHRHFPGYMPYPWNDPPDRRVPTGPRAMPTQQLQLLRDGASSAPNW